MIFQIFLKNSKYNLYSITEFVVKNALYKKYVLYLITSFRFMKKDTLLDKKTLK